MLNHIFQIYTSSQNERMALGKRQDDLLSHTSHPAWEGARPGEKVSLISSV